MPADSEQLKATLDELHRQLAGIDELDPALRGQLHSAMQEIQTALKNRTSPGGESVMRRLGEAARHFEEGHPAISGTIGSLIDTLGRSGI
jgi:hypothetical protein